MPHYGYAGLDQPPDSFRRPVASFQLHRLCAALLDHSAGVAQRLLHAGLVAHEGHVGHYQGPLAAAHHRLYVVDHVVHGHGEGGVVAQDDVSEAVAYQDDRHSALVDDAGSGIVVGGHAHDGLLLGLHTLYLCNSHPHGIPFSLSWVKLLACSAFQ